MNERLSSPIKTLLDTNPSYVVDFIDGCSIIRESLGSRKLYDAHLFLPLRGAMPIYWAASGDPSIEDGLGQPIVELPIGIHHRIKTNGAEKITSPHGNEKHRIINSAINSLYETNSDLKVCLLDEVQKGGTITLAASLTRNCMMRLGINPPLHVIAAQDSRARVVREHKTRKYEVMASNGAHDIDVNVVAMPLIATDREALLDRVYLKKEVPISEVMKFEIEHNNRAEKLIRGMSTLARCAIVRYDDSYISKILEQAGSDLLDETHSARLESWLEKFMNLSKPSAERPKPCDITTG